MSEWMPIETAPMHEGTEILGYAEQQKMTGVLNRYAGGRWTTYEQPGNVETKHSGWFCGDATYIDADRVWTHWIPLPEPPKADDLPSRHPAAPDAPGLPPEAA